MFLEGRHPRASDRNDAFPHVGPRPTPGNALDVPEMPGWGSLRRWATIQRGAGSEQWAGCRRRRRSVVEVAADDAGGERLEPGVAAQVAIRAQLVEGDRLDLGGGAGTAARQRAPGALEPLRCDAIASTTSSTPGTVAATVLRTGGVHGSSALPDRGRSRAVIMSGPQLARGGVGAVAVGLVDDEDVADLGMPALAACTPSPMPGASGTTVVSAAPATSTSLWPDADGLDEHDVEPGGVEHAHPPAASPRRAPPGARARPSADEDAGIGGVVLHADRGRRAVRRRRTATRGRPRHADARPRARYARTSADVDVDFPRRAHR